MHHVLRIDRKIGPDIIQEVHDSIKQIEITSSTLFLKISNRENTSLRKQYIIKNLDEMSLTKEIFDAQIEQISESLKSEVGKKLTSSCDYSWVILLKNKDNDFHCLKKILNFILNVPTTTMGNLLIK